jgi:hypothetical protein
MMFSSLPLPVELNLNYAKLKYSLEGQLKNHESVRYCGGQNWLHFFKEETF